MFTIAQRNSFAQLGLGVRLGIVIGSKLNSLSKNSWQNSPAQPSTLLSSYGFAHLALRGLAYPTTLHRFPTLLSALHDISFVRVAGHFHHNLQGFRGYQWLPKFDAEQIRVICERLRPVLDCMALIALIAFQMRGHPVAKWGCSVSCVSVLIFKRFERASQLTRVVVLASRLLTIAANPVPALAIWLVDWGIGEVENRGFDTIQHSIQQVIARCKLASRQFHSFSTARFNKRRNQPGIASS